MKFLPHKVILIVKLENNLKVVLHMVKALQKC